MTKEIALKQEYDPITSHFTTKQVEILKNSICKGISAEEFEVFLMACVKTKLDPFMKQIYAVPRKFKKPDGSYGNSITIQTGIDGYRLIAERTERYAPGPEPTYTYDDKGNLISATAYIKKLTRDGTWHTVSASAHLDEYMQTFQDKYSQEKKPTGLWVNMPRTMLAKCAEAQALRKSFPAEMSGIYTKEEMREVETIESEIVTAYAPVEAIQALLHLIGQTPPDYQSRVIEFLNKHGLVEDKIPLDLFNQTHDRVSKKIEELSQEIKVDEVAND